MQHQQLFVQKKTSDQHHRPVTLDDFIGQSHIKKILHVAIDSASQQDHTLGHILFAGPSGYGKTTLAEIITHITDSRFHQITAYAITKPAEIISLLQKLGQHDILFIDEIHRMKPQLEEILYIAMEDARIDMILPDGTNLSLPVQPFTLIGATTQPEKLSTPLKNRFIYNFSFVPYNQQEKEAILLHYIHHHQLTLDDHQLLSTMAHKIDTVPREIKNLCTKLRDFMIQQKTTIVTATHWDSFVHRLELEDGGLTQLHKQYLSILESSERPQGLQTIATKLGVNTQSIEQDIEPLLMRLGKIEKTPQGRILV